MRDKKVILIVCLIAIFVVIQFFFMKRTPEQGSNTPGTEATVLEGETASSTTPELE